MGKSTRSCLRFITCTGGDSTDGEDLNPAVIKASPDNSRWSFRKRSSGNRVLSNNQISEPVSAGNIKENPEATTNDFHLLKKTQVQEQSSIVGDTLSSVVVNSIADQTAGNGDTLSSVVVNSVADQTAGNGNNTTDHHLQDSVAIVIQAAIRRYLAQRDLQKLKNIVKLQASVRGHLVRRQAIGTLRCIHALVKMQTLVRARSAQLAVKEDEKSDIDRPMLDRRIRTSSTEQNRTYFSTEKLLSNRFACQLLESTPKTKHMHVKCDAMQSDSTWKWLERWMTVTSPDRKEELEQDPLEGVHGQVENDEQAAGSISSDFKSDSSESAVTNEGEGSSIYRNSIAVEFQSPTSVPNDDCFSSQPNNDKDQSQLENNEALNMELGNVNATKGEGKTSVSFSGQIQLLLDATSQSILSSISDTPESDSYKPKPTAKRPSSSEPLEDKGKKFTLGSRKPCNPAFAAAQSKFEELSSTITPSRCITPAYQDASSESKFESPTYQVASSTKNTGISSVENALPHDPRIQVAASECGTEISISSTLDSPERSEAEDGEIVLEIGAFKKGNDANLVGADDIFNQASEDDTTKLYSLDTEVPHLQREEEGNGDLVNSVAVADAQQMEQQSAEPSTSDTKNHTENSIEPQVYKSTPEGTPRSHKTPHESRGTPPSQATVNTKKGKKDNDMEAKKQIDQLVGTKSPSNSKVARKRKSLETDKPDRVDHEPRISSSSSSSSSLPSYMQATKSARAKAHASTSPKSSPEVHHKDDHTKKRHSLPIGDEKQGSSPYMQKASQAQQNLMGNGTHSPHNSAERRWQR